MYIDIQWSFYRVCLLVKVCMWAFWDHFLFVFTSSHIFFESEMNDLLIGLWVIVLSIIIFIVDVTSLHVWFGLIITFSSYIHCSLSYSSLHLVHLLRFTFLFFSYTDLFQVWYSPLHHSGTSHYQFDLLHCLIIDILFTLGTLRSMTHKLFYTCCILYTRTWVFDHWVFGLSFLSFLLPYHPSLCYVPCLKIILRPWDQMSSSTAPT